MIKRVAILIFSLVFALGFVSAEVILSQPEYIYNIGDQMDISATLRANSHINDFLILEVVCGGSSAEIYRSPFDVGGGEEVPVSVSAVLDKKVIGELNGQCFLKAKYGGDESQSQEFQLSDSIEVDADLQINRFKPGESVIISGEAIKTTTEVVNGFVEISVPEFAMKFSSTVVDGIFSFNFTLPEDSAPGKHTVEIRVYDKSSADEIRNEGNGNIIIEVVQVFTDLKIELPEQNVRPGEKLLYKVTAYDQTDSIIEKEISVIIYEPGDFEREKRLVNSGSDELFEVKENDQPGYWKVEIEADDKRERKLFYVEENMDALFSLIDDTLIATNIGNVPYRKAIEISIGSGTEIKQLDLGIGETRKFKLSAPDGNYLVGVNDGEEEVPLGNVALTGKSIAVGEISEGVIGLLFGPGGFIIGIILLAIIVLIVLRLRKGRGKLIKGSKLSKDQPLAEQAMAAKTVIANGKKEEATAVAIRLHSAVSPTLSPLINEALMIGKNAGGRIYIDGDYRIIIFSETLTGKTDNDILGIKTAKKIGDTLYKHNAKFKEKMEFGIGVNNGHIVSEIKEGKFRFMSVGKIITTAKKAANISKGGLLLSEDIHKRTISSIKAVKVRLTDFWQVLKIGDRETHSSFLADFTKRQDHNRQKAAGKR